MRLRAIALLALAFAAPRADASAAEHDDPRAFWEEIAPTCDGHPSKDDCDDGDMTLFGGLLCASGDERGCTSVRESQGDDGRWWRSPRRRGDNAGQRNSFSRDMTMGVLLYLATTRDADAAVRWLAWIEANRPCLAHKPDRLGGGCLTRGPHRVCTDDADQRCTITPSIWAMMGALWRDLGMRPTAEMQRAAGVDEPALVIEAQTNPPGYQLHLVGVHVLLKDMLGVGADASRRAARILEQRQPENPFFVYLRDGATTQVRERLEAVCPRRDAGMPAARRQWAWERDTATRAWEQSMGWDCLFIDNLLAGP